MSNTINARQGISNLPEICFQHGLKKAIICPGSRNAPLILSFTRHKSIDCLSITDERSAGYFALGISQFTGDPVAVICTSGTAVLNIAPSVAEAYYQNLPLIIITADRPKEWIDQADGQTIRQADIFRNYIKQSFELPLETPHADDLWYFNRTVSQAINTALAFPAGPVHINVPLREPLYTPLPDAQSPIGTITSPKLNQSVSEIEGFVNSWKSSKQKMIIFGVNRKNPELNELAQKLSKRSDTLVFAENISNVSGNDIVYSPETFVAALNDDEKQNCKPDILITIGEGVVSKRLKQYLRAFSPKEHWHIGSSSNYIDTFKSLSSILQVDPVIFFANLSEQADIQTAYSILKNKIGSLSEKHNKFISIIAMNDLHAMHHILNGIPGNSIVHLANSTPIRYSQLFPVISDIAYFCNRGTSGIDGCISTAAGSAFISGKTTFVISGDLAFIYDSNALWNNYINANLKIIVINNNGGNIFSLIESGDEMEKARPFFETPHRIKIKALAEAYNVSYLECNEISYLPKCMVALVESQSSCILEIKTDSKENTRIFKEYYQYIKQSVI